MKILPDVINFLDRFLELVRGRELHTNQPVYDEVSELRKRCLSAQAEDSETLKPFTTTDLMEILFALDLQIETKQAVQRACSMPSLYASYMRELEKLQALKAKLRKHVEASCK